MEKIKKALHNADGSYNGKVIAGLISLIIVLAQQLVAAFGIHFTGDWNAIAAVVNTILTILGLLGVVSGGGVVEVPATVETTTTAPKPVETTTQAPQIAKPVETQADGKNISAK